MTFLVENIGDSSLRMKYRYLGGQGTKPLAAALKVSDESSEVTLTAYNNAAMLNTNLRQTYTNTFLLVSF